MDKAERWQADHRTFWQIAYNLACYDAIRYGQGLENAKLEAAIRRLEIAVERPNSHQLTQSWVKVDPDLQSIRRHERYQQFLQGLPNGERAEADESEA